MSNRHSFLLLHLNYLPWVLLACIVPSPAQTSGQFQWRFANGFLSTSLPTCVSIPIIVEPLNDSTNTTGTPPYYMIAFVLGGTPVTTFIGNDENNLRWSLTEPVNTQLVLSVVDANGDSGGMPPNIYTTIAAGTTALCTTPLETPEFKIATNVTGDLSTCQPWRFTITGGVPPYIITLPAFNSRNVTNETISFGDNSFTYINRAKPGTHLFGAVSDLYAFKCSYEKSSSPFMIISTGRWAHGTAMVKTIGSNDTECTGLRSSSDNSTITQQQEGGTSQSTQRHTVIIAVSVIFSLLVMINFGIAGFLYLRKRRKQADAEFIAVRPFGSSGFVSVKGINRYLASTPRKALFSTESIVMRTASPVQPGPPFMQFRSPTSTNITSVPGHTQDLPLSVSDYGPFDDVSTNPPRSMVSLPSFASFPLTSMRATKNLNNQDRGDSCDEVEHLEFYHNEAEPALSDTGSNVLPRSSHYAVVGTGRG